MTFSPLRFAALAWLVACAVAAGAVVIVDAATIVPAVLLASADVAVVGLLGAALAGIGKDSSVPPRGQQAVGASAAIVLAVASASLVVVEIAARASEGAGADAWGALAVHPAVALPWVVTFTVALLLAVALPLLHHPVGLVAASAVATVATAAVAAGGAGSDAEALTRFAVFLLASGSIALAFALYRRHVGEGPGWRAALPVAAGAAVLGTLAGRSVDALVHHAPRGESPAEILTGSPLPAEWTLATWFTAWQPDAFWIAAVGATATFTFLLARQRSLRWTAVSRAGFVAALVVLLWVTNGPLEVYRHVLMSAALTAGGALVLVGALLALSAPRKAGAARRLSTGSPGAVGAPLFGAASLVAVLWVGMSHDGARVVAGNVWAALVMQLALVGTGALFGYGVVRAPAPYRPIRVAGVLVAAAGLTLTVVRLSGSVLVAPDWFGAMGRTWGAAPLEDQAHGALALAVTAGVAVGVVALGLVARWREGPTRPPRSTQRPTSAALDAYEAELAGLNAPRRPTRSQSQRSRPEGS